MYRVETKGLREGYEIVQNPECDFDDRQKVQAPDIAEKGDKK